MPTVAFKVAQEWKVADQSIYMCPIGDFGQFQAFATVEGLLHASNLNVGVGDYIATLAPLYRCGDAISLWTEVGVLLAGMQVFYVCSRLKHSLGGSHLA